MCNNELTADQVIRLEAVKIAWSRVGSTPDEMVTAAQKVADFVHGPDWRPMEYQKVDAALKRLVALESGLPGGGDPWVDGPQRAEPLTAEQRLELREIRDLLREVMRWQEPPF